MADGQVKGHDIGVLLVRLALGAIMIAHGLGKVAFESSPGVRGFAGYLQDMGLSPSVSMYASIAAIATEIVGGGLVVIGVLSRLASLGIAAIMIFAIFKVHLQHGFFIPLRVDEPGDVNWGIEYNVALLSMALLILLSGPGKLSLLPHGFGRKKG